MKTENVVFYVRQVSGISESFVCVKSLLVQIYAFPFFAQEKIRLCQNSKEIGQQLISTALYGGDLTILGNSDCLRILCDTL